MYMVQYNPLFFFSHPSHIHAHTLHITYNYPPITTYKLFTPIAVTQLVSLTSHSLTYLYASTIESGKLNNHPPQLKQ